MTMLSRSKLKPAYRESLVNRFLRSINSSRNAAETRNLIQHLLTPVEIDTFAKRLEIFKELRKGSTYLEIGDKVKVTGATITKMRNVILKANKNFIDFLDKLIEEDITKEKEEKESKYFKGSKQVYKNRIG